jgi:CubicO group peptidase (beta-lactamase class C family)
MNASKLAKMNQIASEMIRAKAAPGCQVLVAKDGKIVFHKAYGYHTYKKRRRVQLDDVYDLASVTKVAATTISLMKLYEQGKLDINKSIGYYLPELKGSNKANLKIKDILAHQSGLKPWIPFYTRTLDENKKPLYGKYYSKTKTRTHQIPVANQLYFAQGETDSVIWQRIYDQDLRSSTNYRYSDLGFILFTRLVKKLSGKTLDEFAAEQFYRPMGLGMITFNPLQNGIDKYRIIPTEEDDYFRYQKVQGQVHDMASAMLGGVSGHAGLFATATDLAAVYQMLTDGGEFGGKRYLKKSTIDKFSAKYDRNSRRGLGFDRKEVRDGKTKSSVNVAWQASNRTFGHLGFTGIGAWADPENRLVYLFLSNRTYPDMENSGLIRKDIRTRMHEVAYQAAGIE